MAIINPTQAIAITSGYLNLPITAGLTTTGYWYLYVPANPSNTGLNSKIIPYKWETKLPIVGGATEMTINGSMPFINETWNGVPTNYHGGCIEWIGPGINDITQAQEDDAFFFAHLGTLTTTPVDDIFYWDRAFEPFAGTDWEYYQYHQHRPTFYANWENGRQVISGDGWIDPADKAYGYMISTRITIASVSYASVMARIHTPSVGGAHNSHNDVTLPTVSNKDYMPGGILRGVGERYHCFYISSSGTEWEIFTRTYTDASTSFTAQISLGVYDLADPDFDPTLNEQSQYPVRAGCGTNFGAKIYFPVILNNATSGFDLEIWSFNSLDTISGGSLIRQVIASGLSHRPDCYCALYGTEKLYIIYSDTENGGTRIWQYDGTTWTNYGEFLTNNAADPIRIHGFEFNTQDFKFYALLSGTAAGGGTYLGTGLYTFEFDDVFNGYKHLDYDHSTNSFIKRDPLDPGYLQYNFITGDYTRYATTEPQAIGADVSIMNYTQPPNQWYNRKSVGFGGKDFYYQTITLRDGRRFGCGRIVGNPDNRGAPETGDFLVSFYSADLQSALHLAAGTPGDDYLTGCFESPTSNYIWMTGYCKGQIIQKSQIWIHGWCRNMSDGGNFMQWNDIAKDSEGNIYCVGQHDAGWLVVAKYTLDYDIVWQKNIGDGENFTDIGLGIVLDSNDDIYIAGSTEQSSFGSTDALLFKMDTDGNVLWGKAYGNIDANSANSITVIQKSTTEYLVLGIVSNNDTVLLVTDTSGNIIEQNTYTNLVIKHVRPYQSDITSGRYLFAGNDGANDARFGMAEILTSGTNIKWIQGLSSTGTITATDIANIDEASGGLGAGIIICGNDDTKGFVIKLEVDEIAGNFTISSVWQKNIADSMFAAMTVSPHTDTTKYAYVVGMTNNSEIPPMGMDEGLMTCWLSTDGTLEHQNVFGHDMDEQWVSVIPDSTGRNIIVAGWSQSHSSSRDAIFFRYDKKGFGTGIYNLTTEGVMPYYYNASNLPVTTNTATLNNLLNPSNSPAGYNSESYTVITEESYYLARDFDGSYGPNGLFTMLIAYLNLDLLQSWLNSTTYKEAVARGDKVIYFRGAEVQQLGGFYQIATVGDGSADDGNIFGYDIIEHSNGKIYAIGATSGDITKTNLGLSGAYDYLLVELDRNTGNIEFYQNGTEFDEETYALTELSDGRIAYVGRTTGPLGSPNSGGYDLFLGIFDTNTETSEYFSIGTGLDDAALNVHDLNTGSNDLAIVYFSYGSLDGTTNAGSQDLGVIKFNYVTNTWGTAWQTGSETSEIYVQQGKPSALLSNDRIAIVTSSVGVFADDAVTYGYLDVCLAILNFVTGRWFKYQVGTTANEIASSAFAFGDVILVGGNGGGSFTDDVDAIFVEFDALEGLVGRTSSI